MTKNVKLYFERHSHDYADRHTQFYPSIAKYLKNVTVKNNDNNNVDNSLKLLDLGCVDGSFIKAMLGANVKFDYYGTDVSFGMIQLANANMLKYNITLLVADAFNILIKEKTKFDVIDLDSILHHLVD